MWRVLTLWMFTTGCAKVPVGYWGGIFDLENDDGLTVWNDMDVARDGTALVTLYLYVPDPDLPDDPEAVVLIKRDYTATWEHTDVGADFDLVCDWADCDFQSLMSCTYEDPRLGCDATPDIYADDLSALQWERF